MVCFREIYWDIDVVFDVIKFRGKREGSYFYCEECGAYNKVEEFSECICNCCGTAAERELFKKIDTLTDCWQKIKEGVCLEKNLSEITYDTWIRPLQYRIIEDSFFVEAPFEEIAIGYLKQHYREIFKHVIKKETGKNYIVSFVTPKKTTDIYKQELKMINDSIDVVGEYVGAREKILVKCKICGNEWKTAAGSLLAGHGCPNKRKHNK